MMSKKRTRDNKGSKASEFVQTQRTCWNTPPKSVLDIYRKNGVDSYAQKDIDIIISQSLTCDEVLEQAREKFTNDTCKDQRQIEEFFQVLGHSIKIAHPLIDKCDERCKGIDGLFVMSDHTGATGGVIIDFHDNFNIIVRLPPPLTQTAEAITFCQKAIDDYDVYNAVDGTRVILYYFARIGEWLLATANSYDARNYKWMGDKTYLQVFNECSHSFDFATLDKTTQYEFIISHPDFHHLETVPALWQTAGPPLAGICSFSERAISPRTVGEMVAKKSLVFNAQNAFNDYVKSQSQHNINYGYIFKRRDGNHNSGPLMIYLESTLHEFIRKNMYDVPRSIDYINYKNRALYMHIRAYIATPSSFDGFYNHHDTTLSRQSHLMLFPKIADVFTRMDFIIDTLTNLTIAVMRANKKTLDPNVGNSRIIARTEAKRGIGQDLFGEKWENISVELANIAECVGKVINEKGVIGPFGDHVYANVRDQYLNCNNIKTFLKFFE
jgi:hypothetical protein